MSASAQSATLSAEEHGRCYMPGAALTGLYGFLYVGLLNTGSKPLVVLAILLLLPDYTNQEIAED